jgi:general secretion pathway protein M
VNRLSNWFAELAPRERRLLTLFGVVFGVMLLFFVPFGVDAMLRSRRADNAALREAVTRVQAGRSAVKAKQAKREAVVARYAKRAPKLGGFLEQLAKEQAIELPEVQDKPEFPIGKRYVERATALRLRKVGGLAFLKFLEKIEQSGFPVAVTRLNVRKRGGDHDSYDIELAVSAYDRNEVVPAAAATGSAAPPKEKEKDK